MANTPNYRKTRSGSNASGLTLADIKTLIESSKSEILIGVKKEIEKMTGIIESLSNRVAQLEMSNDVLQMKLKHIEEKHSNFSIPNEVTNSICHEISLRKRKEKCLVISGLPEPSSGSVASKIESDEENVIAIADSLGIHDISVSNITRLGRPNTNKPRLLRFMCSDATTRTEFLRKARNLRNFPSYAKTFVSPDLTKLQLLEAKQLRDELKRRRTAGEQVVISGGRIVEKVASQHPLNFRQ